MKKVVPPTFISAVSSAYSHILNGLSSLTNPTAPKNGDMPNIPEIFNPVIRFAVCSDIHNMNDRFRDMMEFCYNYSEKSPIHKTLDAVLVAGDFTGYGHYDEMIDFKKALDDSVKEETTPVICIGNHEYFACIRRNLNEHGDTETKFKNIFSLEPDSVYNINGFTFLAASYDKSGKHYHGRKKHKFYDNAVKNAIKEAPEKPVFVIQHPHPMLTVYGSINWADSELNSIWNKYPNVINFSGHSHYPMNDPRSIWQGGYTALGTGSLKYFELENELHCGVFSPVPDSAAQFYIVEADEKGSVLIKCCDLFSHSFFGETYYIENPSDRKSFRYTYKNRYKSSLAPVFPKDSFVSLTRNEKGEFLLNFTAATDKYEVHDYKIIIKDSSKKTVYSKSSVSDYFMLTRKSKYISVNLGRILKKNTEYSVAIYADNCYYKLSEPLRAKVTVKDKF